MSLEHSPARQGKTILRRRQVLDKLGISNTTLYDWIKRGIVPPQFTICPNFRWYIVDRRTERSRSQCCGSCRDCRTRQHRRLNQWITPAIPRESGAGRWRLAPLPLSSTRPIARSAVNCRQRLRGAVRLSLETATMATNLAPSALEQQWPRQPAAPAPTREQRVRIRLVRTIAERAEQLQNVDPEAG